MKALPLLSAVLLAVALHAQPTPPEVDAGTDRPGGDFRNFDLSQPNPGLCQTACTNDQQCRGWTYVKTGFQGPQARCWLKSNIPDPTGNACCTSGLFNLLKEIASCLSISNTQSNASAACVQPGGRDLGKAGKTFREGDKVMILVRYVRLPPGPKELVAIYSRWENGKFVHFANSKEVLKFDAKGSTWSYWFPALYTKPGRYRISVSLSRATIANGQADGQVEYCINCAVE
jgi:hypothetical protein